MSYIPTLYTPRLRLRPFTLADAPRVQELAGDRRIAATTQLIPHPYPDGAAEKWIQAQQPGAAEGKWFEFAITLAGTRTPGRENDLNETGFVIGAIGIGINGDPSHERAEIGYWIGVPFWNRGFATEAARAILDFGFARRHYHRIQARHFGENIASGRVMRKLGMTLEGTLRQHESKWGAFVDVAIYAILRNEWATLRKSHRLVREHPELQPA